MGDVSFKDLTVEVRKSADGERYEFGVWIGDVFAPFFLRKAGGLDDDLARAAEAAATRASESPPPAA